MTAFADMGCHLLADGPDVDLFEPLLVQRFDGMFQLADGFGIEPSAERSVRCDGHDNGPSHLFVQAGQGDVDLLLAGIAEQRFGDLSQLPFVAGQGFGFGLHVVQFGRGDHLHGRRDLQRTAHRGDPGLDLFERSHGAKPLMPP